MLAKMWKKVLLAVCIIACLYNIMSKIVNRHSLEVNLESVNDGSVVFDFSKEEKGTTSTNPGIIEGVVNPETNTTQNANTTESSVVTQTETNESQAPVTTENTVTEGTTTETVEGTTSEETKSNDSNVVSYSEGLFDKVLDFMGLERK